jgi:hypothetical protein
VAPGRVRRAVVSRGAARGPDPEGRQWRAGPRTHQREALPWLLIDCTGTLADHCRGHAVRRGSDPETSVLFPGVVPPALAAVPNGSAIASLAWQNATMRGRRGAVGFRSRGSEVGVDSYEQVNGVVLSEHFPSPASCCWCARNEHQTREGHTSSSGLIFCISE